MKRSFLEVNDNISLFSILNYDFFNHLNCMLDAVVKKSGMSFFLIG